ncbi:helix-turn-helix transcriptional regulator [Glutamicibacter sp. M10]|uniref:helix-turn-helix domain-containing protein n=1 Tax=Glutamicibacter sp. M10 TaxID=3023076 RepID=UPI0021C9BDEE|nr:helix-turn-helix transcriptional regulator [Glutamicibacter sp. M10]UXN30696.1 helix-turn-helix transcriptional regulator [Glutamicibacter sp. M10]
MATDKKLDLPHVFGENQRRRRYEKGWSQSELARRMQDYGWTKYSQVAVSRTEDGERMVRLDEGLALASVLETTLDRMTVPPDSFATWIQDLKASGEKMVDAAKKLNDAARGYEDLRHAIIYNIETISLDASKQKAVKSLRESLENEIHHLRNLTSLSIYDLLDWIDEEEWKIETGMENEL